MNNCADELLRDAIDMHCHGYPELTFDAKKRMEDVEWITLASKMGMKGAVLKSHFWPTTANVYYLEKQIPEDFRLFSSITLNACCGGVNAWAVEAAAKQGAKVVWMPTWSARQDLTRNSVSRFVKKYIHHLGSYQEEGLSIIDEGGLMRQAKEVLDLVKEMDLVLFTGHISPQESLELARYAKTIEYKKLIFSHPDNPSIGASVEEMKKIVELGAYIEFCFLGTLPLIQRKQPKDMVELIREIGTKRCILTTDAFYDWPPPAPEIMRMGIACMLELGISEEDVRIMIHHNPLTLLGMY